MPMALILSSFVAASRIGGGAQQYVLAAHRIDPVLTPTVMFGRNPARGAEGQVTPPDVLRRMLADVEAGHFSSAEQVEVAAGVLDRVRAAGRQGAFSERPVVVVDPIMGDAPKGLYVKPEVAQAVRLRLAPLADYLTPNVWELSELTGRALATRDEVVAAARSLGKPTLVTSAPAGDGEIGLVYVDGDQAVSFAHARIDQAPNGTGDLVAASFGAGLVEGLSPLAAAERASRAAAETVQMTAEWQATELPLVALAERLVRPTAALRIERL